MRPLCTKPFTEQGLKAFEARPEGTLRPGLDMKGRGQERPLYFSLKSNMAWPKQLQTSHANLFIRVEKCPALISSPFLLRTCISEIKYAKTLAGHGRPLLELLYYTIKDETRIGSGLLLRVRASAQG